mmetsp:Transcript_20286/g.30873  ORF Transcript_20286/g.30873 Transcript_20286/m.30873 type:complete len:511 (+) Transcript_20286:984-2516(+)
MKASNPSLRGTKSDMLTNSAFASSVSGIGTLGKSGKEIRSPLALIVVPTRELGIQTAILLFRLVGGTLVEPRKKEKSDESSPSANMLFKYQGPKSVSIACVLDDQEASDGLSMETDICITSPAYLSNLLSDGDIRPELLRVVVFDEADLTIKQTVVDDLGMLFRDFEETRKFSRITFLVGASVTETLGNYALRSGVIPVGSSYIATATAFYPLKPQTPDYCDARLEAASIQDLAICLDPGLKHQRVIARTGKGMITLTRLIRKELQEYEERFRKQCNESLDSSCSKSRPRVVVYFDTEETAKNAIVPLRDALWGEHQVCVLLPGIGIDPLRIMDIFKKAETSIMLATPNSVRGLDFPALSHVYTLYLPDDDPVEYVHLAGRVGRIGQSGSVFGEGGRVVSIVRQKDSYKVDLLARALGFEFEDVEDPGESYDRTEESPELMKYYEESMRLLRLSDDPDVDFGTVVAEMSPERVEEEWTNGNQTDAQIDDSGGFVDRDLMMKATPQSHSNP